jgi:hypothetical protein
MRRHLVRAAVLALVISVGGKSSLSQEMRPVQTYGQDGRLFNSGTIDYFLISRQRYVSEDSSGYEGDVRAVKNYPGGAYEIIMKHYIARCVAPFDNNVQVIWSNPGDDSNFNSVNIIRPNKFPGQDNKESYNLYWAACHEQFKKFK